MPGEQGLTQSAAGGGTHSLTWGLTMAVRDLDETGDWEVALYVRGEQSFLLQADEVYLDWDDLDRCGHTLYLSETTWECTRQKGHVGPHVGGYDKKSCGCRWWPVDPLKDLDAGSDPGF